MEKQSSEKETPKDTKHSEKPSPKPEPPVSGPLAQFEAWLYDKLVIKAPYQIPTKAKDWIVQYGPWITLVLGILLLLAVIPTLMLALSLSGAAMMYSTYYAPGVVGLGAAFFIALVVLAVQLVIMFVSIPMLMKRQRKGWQLVFYANVVSLAYTVINSFSYGGLALGTLLMGLISATLGFYVLFQIRSYYKI